MQERKTIYQY